MLSCNGVSHLGVHLNNSKLSCFTQKGAIVHMRTFNRELIDLDRKVIQICFSCASQKRITVTD